MRFTHAAAIAAVVAPVACASLPPGEWRGTVQPRAGSSVEASVQANTVLGNTAVGIAMIGGQPGGEHPWHIHEGTCEEGGTIFGDPDAYPPLRPGPGGGATADARLRTHLNPGESYHVNVHRSPDALDQIIACGNLRLD